MAFLALPEQQEQGTFDLLGKPQDPTQKDWFSSALPQMLQTANAFGQSQSQQDQGQQQSTFAANTPAQMLQALLFQGAPDPQGTNIGQEQVGGGPAGTGVDTGTSVSGNFGTISPQAVGSFNLGSLAMDALGLSGSPLGVNIGLTGSISPRVNTSNAAFNTLANNLLGAFGTFNPASLAGPMANSILGPIGAVGGAFQGLVGLAGKIAQMTNTPTVHDTLSGMLGNTTATSAAVGDLSAALASINQGTQSVNLSPQAAALAVAMGLGPNLFAGPLGTQLMNIGNVASSPFSMAARAASPFGQVAPPTGIFSAPRSGGDDVGDTGDSGPGVSGPGAPGSGGVDAP